MKIGIMGAMPEEINHIKELMDITDIQTIGKREFYSGKIHDHDVTLVFSRWGKVAATCSVTTLLDTYGVDFILFTGVAGGVDPSLNVGDVVIAESLYQHDMDGRPFFPRFQIPLTDHKIFRPREEHIELAHECITSFLSETKTKISRAKLDKFSILKTSRVVKGTIATGDRFVGDAHACDSLSIEEDGIKAVAVEMEGAAVAQICEDYDKPYLIIRIISDNADHTAHVDFEEFIDEIASEYSAGIASNFLSRLN